jgi:flagellar hook assembly protein FlgD
MEVSHLVQAAVYDINGQKVAQLLNRVLSPGRHEIVWDGSSSEGEQLPAGVYFLRIETESAARTAKMLMVR